MLEVIKTAQSKLLENYRAYPMLLKELRNSLRSLLSKVNLALVSQQLRWWSKSDQRIESTEPRWNKALKIETWEMIQTFRISRRVSNLIDLQQATPQVEPWPVQNHREMIYLAGASLNIKKWLSKHKFRKKISTI